MLRRAISAIMESSTATRIPIPAKGVDYRGKVVLAPMVRSGELPSRLVALKYGADLVWGPETIDRALIGAQSRRNDRASTIEFTRVPSNIISQPNPKESIIYRISPERESSRLIFQLGTASPDLAVQAAHVVAPYVAGIDVNSGCPKPFSTSGGMGAALLSTPDLLCDILRKLVQEVGNKYEIGISVKIRLLPKPGDTRALVERLVLTGIIGLTIHCRTRAMRKTEKAIRDQLRMVGEICRSAGVACLMNGDVEGRNHADILVREFNVDGAMIAEAAEKNLSVFRSSEDGGPAPWREVVRAYMEEALAIENRWGNTKFLLAQLMPGKEQGRCGLGQARNYADVCKRLGYEDLQQKATRLDELLDMTDRQTKGERKVGKKQKHNESNPEAPTCEPQSKRQCVDQEPSDSATSTISTPQIAPQTQLAV